MAVQHKCWHMVKRFYGFTYIIWSTKFILIDRVDESHCVCYILWYVMKCVCCPKLHCRCFTFYFLRWNVIITKLVVGSCWLSIDFGSKLLVSVSISQYQLILWYFTANSFQLGAAIQGDVADSINNIFLTFFSSFCSCTWVYSSLSVTTLLALH